MVACQVLTAQISVAAAEILRYPPFERDRARAPVSGSWVRTWWRRGAASNRQDILFLTEVLV